MSVFLDVRRPPSFEGMELTAFAGRNSEFSPSYLSDYDFGVRLQGVRETTYRGERFRSGPGTFLAYTPGVALAAKPISEGPWQYLDMSLTPSLLGTLLDTDPRDLERTPLRGSINPELGSVLFTNFVESHTSFRQGASKLEQETRLLTWLQPLFKTAADTYVRGRREHRAVTLVREYLDEHTARNVGLDELSTLVGLNKEYLLRVFKQELGLTPYKYQMGIRLAKAKDLLWRGVPPAEVAIAVGLYDQSALNRLFKRHNFVTPGSYRSLVGLHARRRA